MNKNLKALTSVLFLTVLVAVIFTACRKDETPRVVGNSFYTFTDSLGNEVVLTEKPQRAAVLFSSLCNVWKNAGGEALITVGESVERGFCGEDALLVDSGAGKSINTELLISYKPDFVIYSSDIPAQKQAGELLAKAGIPSAAVRLDSFEDYLSALKLFCDITENEQNYEIYGESIKEDIDCTLKKAKRLSGEPEILFIRSGSSQSSCKAKKSEDNFAAKMLEELGCINIADSAPVLLDGLSVEEVLMNEPDYIFVSIMGDEKAGREYMQGVFFSDAWKSLDSEIVYLPKELFHHKPCEKWNLAYDYLVQVLYPILFVK